MYYRELGKQDLMMYRVLLKTITTAHRNPEYWMPIEADINTFFDEVWTYFQGCFTNDGKLIAASGLFLNPADTAHDAYELGLDPDTTAEISRCMVLSSFRGKGIALKMNDALELRAQVFGGKKDLIIKCHANDYGMNQSAISLGMKVEKRDPAHNPPLIYYRKKLI